jgi:branched-subunit amino acid transport protein
VAEIWLVILLGGALTFGIRLSFIALHGKWNPPVWFQRALRFVPPAVLSAIILPEMIIQDGHLITSPLNPRLIAGLIAILVALRSRNTFLTIIVGMACLYIMMAIAG